MTPEESNTSTDLPPAMRRLNRLSRVDVPKKARIGHRFPNSWQWARMDAHMSMPSMRPGRGHELIHVGRGRSVRKFRRRYVLRHRYRVGQVTEYLIDLSMIQGVRAVAVVRSASLLSGRKRPELSADQYMKKVVVVREELAADRMLRVLAEAAATIAP